VSKSIHSTALPSVTRLINSSYKQNINKKKIKRIEIDYTVKSEFLQFRSQSLILQLTIATERLISLKLHGKEFHSFVPSYEIQDSLIL